MQQQMQRSIEEPVFYMDIDSDYTNTNANTNTLPSIDSVGKGTFTFGTLLL